MENVEQGLPREIRRRPRIEILADFDYTAFMFSSDNAHARRLKRLRYL